jgi:PKD repeat protein
MLAQPFADLPSEASGDRGLIGIAFDPDFGASNHYVYFYYTGLDLLNRLVRFDASGDVGTNGPLTIFQTQSPSQLLHVGGSIGFGPDGKLYFAVGDNGYPPNGQDLTNPHGKILRINKDGTIPADNPFYGQPGRLGAIWAYGFRNPWRFQFDPATGELYGGDVGNYTWEELNHIVRGGNYGWPTHEGLCASTCAGFVDPIHAYNHDGAGAAITGGPVYRGDMFPPEYRGSLFFGDYTAGFVKRAVLDAAGNVTAVADFDTAAGSVVDLKVAPDGALYYLTYYPGRLYRIGYDLGNQAPTANATADVTKGVEPLTVHFSSAGSTDPEGDELEYAWDLGDGTTSTEPDPVHSYPEIGVYTATLTVTDAQGLQAQAVPVVIQVGVAPTVTVATPADGSMYRAGDTITYNAFATDAAGLDLDDGDIKTEVLLHHNTHIHPFVGPLTGRAGSFTIPVTGEAAPDTWHEIRVTATDANGLSTTKSVAVFPHTSTMTFASSPPGVIVGLDGVPHSTPYTVEGVEGFKREIAAPPTATGPGGAPYHFTGWSDGRAIRHFVTTPAADNTYTAAYAPSGPWRGEYFDNRNLAGTPVLVRDDPVVDFLWATASPAPGVPADSFSVRWTKRQYFAEGRYRFTAASDDGVRLYLDGERVVDGWTDQSGQVYTYVADLGAGEHDLKMEFYDNAVDATAKLSWETTLDQPGDTFAARYWNTPGAGTAPAIPTGTPALTRDEPEVNHDWGSGSPGPAVNADHFVARYTRTVNLTPGVYEFTTTTDDGVRLYVDGQRVVDKWVDQGPTGHTASLTLAGGAHAVVMEYYENGGGAVARLGWMKTADLPPPADYQAEFWNTPGTGAAPPIPAVAPDVTRAAPGVDFDWGEGSPDPLITPDRFVARWTRTVQLPAGVYRLSGASDDGVRVYVDNALVVDKWRDQNEPYTADAIVFGGQHTIRVEYYEHGAGALMRFGYTRVGDLAPPPGFQAEYYPNTTLSGPPALTRQDEAVDFDWGAGSPDPALPADGFSARWTKTEVLPAGTYRMNATSDDGVRVYIDGVVVLDGWGDHPPTSYTQDVTLTTGEHTVVVEYYDSGGGALARASLTRL